MVTRGFDRFLVAHTVAEDASELERLLRVGEAAAFEVVGVAVGEVRVAELAIKGRADL